MKSPGFTITTVLILGLGIGANTAMFSLVDAVLLRPLPYPEPGRLIKLWETFPNSSEYSPVSYPDYLDWRSNQRTFDDLSLFRPSDFNLSKDGDPERFRGAYITASYFRVMKISPLVGREFSEEEDRAGMARVVLLSERLWRSRFQGDLGIIGRKLILNGNSLEVIGVIPATFDVARRADLYVPLSLNPDRSFVSSRDRYQFDCIGRLKEGITQEQAEADLLLISSNLQVRYPGTNAGVNVKLIPLLKSVVGEYSATLWFLMGAVGFLLLITCANVTNLLLSRAVGRHREIVVRAALGASRRRIIGQLMMESFVLSILGGVLGLLLTFWIGDGIIALGPKGVPRLQEVRVDSIVFVFSLLVTVATAFLFGAVPAWRISRTDLNSALKEEGGRGGSIGRQQSRSQAILVIIQVSLACVLLMATGLLGRSFQKVQDVQLGFRPDHLLTAGISLPPSKYSADVNRRGFYENLLERTMQIPGVHAAAVSSNLPFSGHNSEQGFVIPGQAETQQGPAYEAQIVSPDYFRAMEMPVLRGRGFDSTDRQDKPLVIVIDETFARRYFSDRDPIGQQISDNEEGQPGKQYTIIGVVPTVRHDGLDAEPKYVQAYFPFAQNPSPVIRLLVRAESDPLSLTNSVRKAVLSVDPDQPIFGVETMESLVGNSLAGRRLSMILASVFSALALFLTGAGLYGVLAYSIGQRTREIAIRIALGAPTSNIFELVVRQGFTLVGTGLIIGILAALIFSRSIGSILYGVSANDPLTLGLTVLVLGFAGVIACLLPALRATRISPIIALRE